MNRHDLAAAVAETAGLARPDAVRALDAVVAAITASLARGDEVKLVGFGSFHVSRRKASSGRNPRTGEPMPLAARNQAKFTAGKALRDAIN